MSTSEDDTTRWTDRAVSWGNLLLALCVVMLAVGGIVITNEQRITRMEVRQAQVIEDNRAQDERYYRTVANRNHEFERLRTEINTKLDRIGEELSALKITVAETRTKR